MKDIVCITVIGVCLVFVVFQFYMLYRNSYVCNYRTWVNDTMPLSYYDRLPSYNKMYWQLFRWDWSDYLKGED